MTETSPGFLEGPIPHPLSSFFSVLTHVIPYLSFRCLRLVSHPSHVLLLLSRQFADLAALRLLLGAWPRPTACPTALQGWDEEQSPTGWPCLQPARSYLRAAWVHSKQAKSQLPWRTGHFGCSNLQLSIWCLVDSRAKSELEVFSGVW